VGQGGHRKQFPSHMREEEWTLSREDDSLDDEVKRLA
jgi:hypothetical protein